MPFGVDHLVAELCDFLPERHDVVTRELLALGLQVLFHLGELLGADLLTGQLGLDVVNGPSRLAAPATLNVCQPKLNFFRKSQAAGYAALGTSECWVCHSARRCGVLREEILDGLVEPPP